jgi:putative inorganic carbon (HCO3(-)) transporter
MPITAFVFILAFLASTYAIFFIDAYYGILMYIALTFFNPNICWWGANLPSVRYTLIVAIFTIIGFAIRYKKYSNNRILSVPQSKWLLGLLILMGLVSFIAVWPENHQRYYLEFVKFQIIVFLIFKLIDTPEKFEKIIGVYIFSVSYVAWLVHGLGRQDGDRLGIGVIQLAGGSDENGIAAMFVTIVPFLLVYLLKGKTWQKLVSFFMVAYILNGIILCNSRGAFLALIVSIGYMTYFLLMKKVKDCSYKLKTIIGLFGVVCLFFYLVDPVFIGRMDSLKKGSEADGTGEHSRIYFWMKALDMARDHPFGTGAGGYMYLSPLYLPPESLSQTIGTEGVREVHSTFFQALAEYGYLGFILYIGLLLSTFNLMRKVRRFLYDKGNSYSYFQSIALEVCFIARLITSTFLSNIYGESGYWIIGFIAAYGNIYLNKRDLVREISE